MSKASHLFVSRKEVSQAILQIGIGFMLFIVLGSFIIFKIASGYEWPAKTMLYLTGQFFYLIAVLFLRHYLINTPKVIISTTKLTVKSLFKYIEIPLSDIVNVRISQKSPYHFIMFSTEMESTIINPRSYPEIVIWDHLYENINEFKTILERVQDHVKSGDFNFQKLAKVEPKATLSLNKVHPVEFRQETFKIYKGKFLLTFDCAVFYGLLAFSIFKFEFDTIEIFLVINGFTFMLFGYQSNYFLLSGKFLQVRNHLWFWKRVTIRFTDVKEVVVEMPHNLAISLRVVYRNNSSGLIPASSLSNKQWVQFMNDLEANGVKVKDQLHIRSFTR